MKNCLLLLSLGLFIVFAGCNKDEETAYGVLHIRLTDAPAVYDSVLIEIMGVEVHSSNGGWMNLYMPAPGIYNLLDYANGLDTLIASSTFPTGVVSQIRLVLGSHNSVVVNGQNHPLTIPSGGTSGLKLNVHSTVTEGITTVILIDFDAARSIVEQGNGSYQLKPVIRASAQGIDGAIKGILNPAVQATVCAANGTDTLCSVTDSTGSFLIQALPAGTYDVIVYPVSPYSGQVINGVVVSVGNVTDVGVVML